MTDVRRMLKSGGLKLGKGATLKIGGKVRRPDGSKTTLSPAQKRRASARAASKRARASRKANR